MFKKFFHGLEILDDPQTAPGVDAGRQKTVARLTAAVFFAAGVAFFAFALFTRFITQHGQADLSDNTLLPVTLLMMLGSLGSYLLIRRERIMQGLWLLFFTNLTVPPIAAELVLSNVYLVAMSYLVVLALLLIFLVFPQSRPRAILAAVLTMAVLTGIELWNPPFRVHTSNLTGFAPIITAIAAMVLVGFFIRQAVVGNIRTKLITAFVLIAVIAVSTVVYFVDQSSRANLTKTIGNNTALVSTGEASQVGGLLATELDILNTMALSRAVQERAAEATSADTLGQTEINALDKQWQSADAADNNADPLVAQVLNDSLSAELLKLRDKYPENVEIFLTDRKGLNIATTDRTSDYLQADEEWWQLAYKDGQYIGQPEYDASAKTLAINMAVAVHAPNSERVVGVLRTTVDINSLDSVLLAGSFGNTGRTSIVIPGGQQIALVPGAGGNYELAVVNTDFDPQVVLQSGQSYMLTPVDGVQSLTSVASVADPEVDEETAFIKNLDWYTVTRQEQTEALAPVAAETRTNLILGVIIAVLAGAAAVVLAQVLAGPIVRLNEVAEKVAAGDLSVQAKVETRDETGALALTFNKMVAQLNGLIGSLEQRVADRTKALATSADVSRRLSTFLDEPKLVIEVVDQIKAAFGYYHAHIYLLNESTGELVMAGGTGEAGKTLLEKGHKIARGRGLVGRAAETKNYVLVPDTSKDPDWLPNPLLPETKSEVAVPILAGDEVLGVLDVQNNVPDSLGQQDADMISSIANQVAIALQNIRQYQETQHTAAQLAEALEIAKLGNWSYDLANDRFHFNDNFYAIFHTSAAEMGGYELSSAEYAERLVHPDDAPLVGKEIERALASPDRHYNTQLEHRVIYKDGGVGYISVNIYIERDENGNIIRWYGANQDITERRLAEDAIRKSEAQLSEALQIAKLANWEYDVERDRFHFNDNFYSIFHTTAEAMGGYEISSAEYADRLVHPEDVPLVGQAIEKALASTDRHYSTKLEHRVIYADGGVGYISVEVHIDRDENGKIVRYYGANQDITERKLAEEALRKSEAELSEALDIAKLANWDYDVEHDIFHFNDHFYSIFHTNAEQMGGYELSSAEYAGRLVYPEDMPLVGAAIEKALASTDRHYSTRLEHRVNYMDGGVGYISVEVHIDRDENGKILRYYGANQDITERKQAEEALAKRAAELELAARVSTAAATIIDADRLMQEVVDLTKQTFGLYHAHIYLLDESGDALRLSSGAGDVGKQMVAEGRSIPMDREQSLVARAARNRQGVIVNNVSLDTDFLPHPLLPETRSELAVPMIVGDRVIGVFDIQSDKVNRFTDEDIRIQTTLAAQIAVALQNARAYSVSQRQAEREAALNAISQKIQAATSVEAVLQIAARELGRTLNAPLAIAQLNVKEGKNGNDNGHGNGNGNGNGK